jgi:hypothetical protein
METKRVETLTLSNINFSEEIRKAQDEMKTWTPERRANVRLEGTDVYRNRTLAYLKEKERDSGANND